MLRKLRTPEAILLTQDLLVSKTVELKLRSKTPKASVLPLHQLVCFFFKAYISHNFPTEY